MAQRQRCCWIVEAPDRDSIGDPRCEQGAFAGASVHPIGLAEGIATGIGHCTVTRQLRGLSIRNY